MRKEVIAFCFFTAILILGLLIMIKPHYFVSYFPNEQSMLNQRVGENNIPKEIIWIASLLIVIGLVGLAILGFRLFEDLQDEANTNAND